MRPFLNSTATLIGTIIGAGIFGVPFVAARSGFVVAAMWIIGLAILVMAVHLFYAEVVIATPGKHRLPGYADRYLGHPWKHLIAIMSMFGLWGSQTAYIILGGHFLALLANANNQFLFSALLFAVVATSTFFGLWFIGRMEFFMTLLLLIIIALIIGGGIPYIQFSNFYGYDFSTITSPYGVILFSLLGALAIPEMYDIVHRRRRVLKQSIVTGTLIAVVITFLFTAVVIGITGAETTESTLSGLQGRMPSIILFLGALFGFLAILTSYLISGLYLTELFQYDYRLKRPFALIIGVGIPFLLFLAGSRSFVRVIDITGGVFGSFEAIVVMLSALAVFRHRQYLSLYHPKVLVAVLAALIFFAIMIHKIFEVAL